MAHLLNEPDARARPDTREKALADAQARRTRAPPALRGPPTPGSVPGTMKILTTAAAALPVLLVLTAPVAGQTTGSEPVRVDDIRWVDPPPAASPGVEHRTFESRSMGREVGYSIYLPPDYQEGEGAPYPVVYWLHGRGGSEGDVRPAAALHRAIESGLSGPMVLVMANGGVASGYIDNPATGVMGESVVIDELIPHVEANYSVSTEPGGRGIGGFSMGGGGAIRLVIRHPRSFSTILSVAGVIVGSQELMERNFVVDTELARSHDPFPNAIDAAARLRAMNVKLLVGSEDSWVAASRRFAAHLTHQNLAVDYAELPAIGHDLAAYLAEAGDEIFRFFSSNLRAGP